MLRGALSGGVRPAGGLPTDQAHELPRPPVEDGDTADLRQFGYVQQLRRSMGSFSSFAVAFSLISVFTGVSANFGHGLRQVGGSMIWSWLIVLAGQMLVALLLAELSTCMPLSGYGYEWTSRLVNPHFGFFVGWLLTLQFLTGFPGVCATLAAQTGHWLGGGWASPQALTALTLAVIALTALVHLFGIRLASHVNNTGVWTELLGVFGLSLVLIFLAFKRAASPAALLESSNVDTGSPAGLGAWALSLLVGAGWITPVRVIIGVSVFAYGLASMAATSRLLFALARDRMLPGSRWLAFVAEGHRTPRNAILFIWAVSSAVVLALPSLDIITQISAVAGYLGYAGIVLAALSSAPPPAADGFRLGGARLWIGGAALVWVLGVVAALTIPPTPLAGIQTQHLPALSTTAGVLLGVVIYAVLVRPRLLRGEAGPPTNSACGVSASSRIDHD